MVQKLTYVDDQQGTLLVKLVKKPGGIPPACVMHIKTKLVISSWQSSFFPFTSFSFIMQLVKLILDSETDWSRYPCWLC